MDEQAEQAANSLVRNGLANSSNSRRIVQEVLRVVLDEESEHDVCVHPNDIHTLDQLAEDITHLVWELEEVSSDQKTYLLDIIGRSQHIIRVARRYVLPGADHKDRIGD